MKARKPDYQLSLCCWRVWWEVRSTCLQVIKFEYRLYWWWSMPCCWCFSSDNQKMVYFKIRNCTCEHTLEA